MVASWSYRTPSRVTTGMDDHLWVYQLSI